MRHAPRLHAAGLQASFLLVNGQEPTRFYEVMLAPNTAAIDAASADAEALLTAAGAEHQHVVAHGDPAKVLLDIAETRAVDGSRATGALESALLDAVA